MAKAQVKGVSFSQTPVCPCPLYVSMPWAGDDDGEVGTQTDDIWNDEKDAQLHHCQRVKSMGVRGGRVREATSGGMHGM